jgi:hypothetical protein
LINSCRQIYEPTEANINYWPINDETEELIKLQASWSRGHRNNLNNNKPYGEHIYLKFATNNIPGKIRDQEIENL